MTISRFTSLLIAAAFGAALASGAYGQNYFNPVIDRGDMGSPDLQFFAPAEITEYGGEPHANTGWFGTYDRLYYWISRPNQEQSATTMDATWGNRINVGYNTAANHGWLFTYNHIDGPQAVNVLVHEKIDQFIDEEAAAGGGGGGGGGQQQDTVVFPSTGRNDSETRERLFFQNETLNVAEMHSFEVNKTFRLDAFHKGGFLEPFVGARYIKFTDFTETGSYARFDNAGLPIDITTLANALIEEWTVDKTSTTNNMVGGQLGLRYFRQRSAWTLSGDMRAFALQNFVDYERNVDMTTILYQGLGAGTDAPPTVNQYSRVSTYDHGAEFVFGMEARVEAAYQLTREISLNCGVNFMDMGKGVLRGAQFTQRGEDVVMTGINFGFHINR